MIFRDRAPALLTVPLFLVLLDGAPTAGATTVAVATYDGVINPVAAEYLTHALTEAAAAGAEALVLKLDTPGGLDTSMRLMVKEILASDLPVVVWVAPEGARAASAGVFIALAAHVAAMAPGTNIGAAHPVAMGGGEMDKTMASKVENDAAAYIRSIAEKRGRNVNWAERAVRASVSATEKEALALKVIDLVAPDLPRLLAAIDGREVVTAAGARRLATAGAAQHVIEMSTRLRVLRALSDPNVAYILMMLGVYGLIFELSNPGSILPGVVGAICLILAFYAFQTLPINYAGLLLILLALTLFVAEIKVMSYGLLTVGGIVALVLGSLMLIETDLPFMRISLAVILPVALGTAVIVVVAVGSTVRAHRRPVVTGAETLIGAVGQARTDLAPRGQVQLHGELWEARAEAPVARGDWVEVTGRDGLTLIVRRRRAVSGGEAS